MKIIDHFIELFTPGEKPNKFTEGMGNLIRQAREEAGISQRDLAEKVYRRQAALSDMENGKMEPDASTLLLLSHYLCKPISYFYPEFAKSGVIIQTVSETDQEFILVLERLDTERKKLLLIQAKALAKSS